MTDMEIPQAAVEAVYEARGAHRDASECSGRRCSCGQGFPTAVKQLEHETRALLGAALPHLQATEAEPEFEPPMCEEIGCVLRLDHRPGHVDEDGNAWPLPTEVETKALMETATEYGRRIGRQEAAEEIAAAIEAEESWKPDCSCPECHIAATHARLAREIGKGDPNG